VTAFVDEILTASGAENEFLNSFAAFQQSVARLGMLNSLSQTLLKLTCPGVPDLYQGTELWDLSLVDPDNRRPVDYSRRARILTEMENWPTSAEPLRPHLLDLTSHMSDGRIKMYLTWKALNLRKQQPELFLRGDYLPLKVQGPKAKHLLAFSRRCEGSELVVAVPRLCAKWADGEGVFPADQDWWKDTRVELNPHNGRRTWRNIFTTGNPYPENVEQKELFQAAALFADFPVAIVVAESVGEAKS
jgi:(1->4)-alpha-D-glucan 1-alpha-D-glucosylmutase